MKNSIKYLIIFGITAFLSSCSPSTDNAPAKVCKLQSERYSSQGSSGDATSYEYNAQKQLVKTVKTYGNTASETSNFTYDSNGFLTGINGEYVYNSGGTNIRTTTIGRCEYKNNQLSLLSSQRNSSNGTSSNESYTFEYDSQQKLSKVIYSSSNATSNRQTYTFSNDKLIGYISRTPAGVETQPLVIENGLIKRKNFTGIYDTYEYDTQGRKTRTDTWQNGRIIYSTVFTYEENGKNPEEANPFYQLKGWDGFKIYQAAAGEYKPGLQSRETYYQLNGNNLYKYSEYVYSNALNAKGFPTQINTTQTSFSNTGVVNSTSNNTRTYTYTDCE